MFQQTICCKSCLVLSEGLVKEVLWVATWLSDQDDFRPQLVDQLGVVLDQKCVVLPIEVDISEKLLLAHLLSLLLKIALKRLAHLAFVCHRQFHLQKIPKIIPLHSHRRTQNTGTWSIIESGSSGLGSGQVSSGKLCRYVRVASPFVEKACNSKIVTWS